MADHSSLDVIDRIKAIYEDEQRKPPVVRTRDDVPASYDSLNPEWLTTVLCAAYPQARVESFSLDQPDSGTSNRRRVFLTYNAAGQAAGLPPSVFCKAAHELVNRLILSNGGALSEVLFFNKVRDAVDFDAPRALYADYDRQSFASLIMLYDMAEDVTFCRHDTPVTLDMCKSQASLLARLHGKYYESPEFDGELSEVLTWQGRFAGLVKRHAMEQTCINGFLQAESIIPPRLFARADEIWLATLKSVKRHDELPVTLNHGDVHLKNWYVRNAGQTMGLSDWQTLNRGHWSRDLAYMIGTALEVEDRRRWEQEIIRHYLKALQASGGVAPSFEEAWLNYRQQLFGALAFWTQTMAPTRDMPEMQPRDTTLQFIGRLSHAIDDLESLDSFR